MSGTPLIHPSLARRSAPALDEARIIDGLKTLDAEDRLTIPVSTLDISDVTRAIGIDHPCLEPAALRKIKLSLTTIPHERGDARLRIYNNLPESLKNELSGIVYKALVGKERSEIATSPCFGQDAIQQSKAKILTKIEIEVDGEKRNLLNVLTEHFVTIQADAISVKAETLLPLIDTKLVEHDTETLPEENIEKLCQRFYAQSDITQTLRQLTIDTVKAHGYAHREDCISDIGRIQYLDGEVGKDLPFSSSIHHFLKVAMCPSDESIGEARLLTNPGMLKQKFIRVGEDKRPLLDELMRFSKVATFTRGLVLLSHKELSEEQRREVYDIVCGRIGTEEPLKEYLDTFSRADASTKYDMHRKALQAVKQNHLALSAIRERISSERPSDESDSDMEIENEKTDLLVSIETDLYKVGGLGAAVSGLAHGLQTQGHTVSVITPYHNKLKKSIREELDNPDTPYAEVKHYYDGKEATAHVYTVVDKGIEYMIAKPVGDFDFLNSIESSKSFYSSGSEYDQSARKLYFASVVSTIAVANRHFGNVVFNDAHATLAMKRIAHLEHRPSLSLVMHNAEHPDTYYCGKEAHKSALKQFGIELNSDMNSLIEAIDTADSVATVSKRYKKELLEGSHPTTAYLSGHLSGKDRFGAFDGIINGIHTISQTPASKVGEDLAYTTATEDIHDKKHQCATALQRIFDEHYNGIAGMPGAETPIQLFDSEGNQRPLMYYVGRFDKAQKGLHHFFAAVEAAKEKGAALIIMGANEEGGAKEELDFLHAHIVSCQGGDWGGAMILREDHKPAGGEDKKYPYQAGFTRLDGTQVPGVGGLVLTAATCGLFPSTFEPCGLVQLEAFVRGVPVITTDTGGFVDTVSHKLKEKIEDDELFTGIRVSGGADTMKVELEEALESLVEHMKDQDKIKTLMKSAESHDWSKKPGEDYSALLRKAQRNKDQRAYTFIPSFTDESLCG